MPDNEHSDNHPRLQRLTQSQALPAGLLRDRRAVFLGSAALLLAGAAAIGLIPGIGPPSGTGAATGGGAGATTLIAAVPSAEIDRALDLLVMSEADKIKVRAALGRGTLRLGRVIVSDSQAEDGDWVRVSAAGFNQDIRLFHKPHTVIVPYAPGVPVTVSGLVDGGGGITVAVHVATGVVGLKPLKQGEAVQVPTQ